MNGKTDKQSTALAIFFCAIVMVFFMVLEYFFLNGHINEYTNLFTKGLWHLTLRNGNMIYVVNRIIYSFVLLMGFHLANQKRKGENPDNYGVYFIPFFLTYIPIAYGYVPGWELYNNVVLPIILLANTIFTAIASRSFLKKIDTTSGDPLNAVSCKEENDMSIDFQVTLPSGDQAILRIHSPQQGVYVQGGAGAGKSGSIVEPAVYQYLTKGFGAYIYDFKGNEAPLAKAAYNTFHFKKDDIIKKGYKVPTFHYFNLVEPFKTTGKINPISPKYIKHKLYADTAAEVLYKNLDKSAIKKTDFWINNGINYTSACIWRLVTLSQSNPKYAHLATIPHLITLMLQPITDVVEFLLQDEEIGPLVASIKSAYENEAGSQLSGVEATAQIPFGKLYNKLVFWFLNPLNESEEIPLNINNPENPIALCISNSESLKDALQPIIGVITNSMINCLNDSKKFHKTALIIDELPTQYIKDLDFVPATMRSKKVVTFVTVQGYAQLERDYGKDQATVIIENLGNQFFGMTNNSKNAEDIARMFGEYDKPSESTSTSDSGTSVSESTKKEKVRQGSDISSQPLGHFSGKVADGKPAFFSCQFSDGAIHKMLNIEKKDIIEIPYVNFPVKDNFTDMDKKLQFQTSIFNELLNDNFKAIVKDIKELLAPIQELKAAAKENKKKQTI